MTDAPRPEPDTGAGPPTDDEAGVATPAAAPPRRRRHLRRLLRGRLRPALAAAVAGAVLAGTAVAWQAGAGPFAEDRVCWDALERDSLSPIIDDPDELDAAELPPVGGRTPGDGRQAVCRLSHDGERMTETLFTARLHELGGDRNGASGKWAEEFLSGRMSPLGGGLLGMASDERAWLAIPDGCLGPPRVEGPTVVDVSGPFLSRGGKVDTGRRDALARIVVDLVNAVGSDLGCGGTIADPVAGMPRPPRYTDHESGAFCGVDGLRAPPGRRDDDSRFLVTPGHGPVRTCDQYQLDHERDLRLTTVEDPRLARIYRDELRHGGARIDGGADYGSLDEYAGVFGATCQTGRVVFLVRAEGSDDHANQVRELLPRYVEAEARRLGCGSPTLRLPPDPT
ncbi:hypothetical protein [Streptomyces sp. MAR4 CNX-425]|uniref:hypothetical protein n=1 Tax=Streptomyces sp. MAR4 CNX-425 TaxID=3406343 RepID=UPI003B50B3B6